MGTGLGIGVVEGFKGAIVADMTSFGATLVQFQQYEPRFADNRVADTALAAATLRSTRSVATARDHVGAAAAGAPTVCTTSDTSEPASSTVSAA